MRLNISKATLVLFALAAFGSVGCVKKRADQNQQSGSDQYNLGRGNLLGGNSSLRTAAEGGNYIPRTNSVLSTLSFKLTTGKAIAVPSNSRAEKQTIEEGTDFFNRFAVVPYTVSAGENYLPLNLPLLGRENFTYDLVYELTENYLKIYKVGTETDIPYIEQTYARKDLVMGKLAVPLYGYPITYYKDEYVRNENNKDTNIKILKEVRITDEASWDSWTKYDIKTGGGQPFKAADKPELFPKTFFDGEWYFYAVLAKARPGSTEIVGGVINAVTETTRFEAANRIRFEIKERELIVYDLNIDKDIDSKDSANLVSALRIPIQNVQYKSTPTGKFEVGLEETEANEISWKDRPYLRFKWEDFKDDYYLASLNQPDPVTGEKKDSSILALFATPQISDLRIANDFLSFTVRYDQAGIEYKYSFKRNNPKSNLEYQPRRYFEDDLSFFGFFSASRQDVLNYRNPRYNDLTKLTSMARFNPNTKEVVFHLSNNSPDTPWIKSATAQALAYWNASFKAAGSPINVRFDEKKVDLGDHRYNIVNVVDSVYSTSGLLGYGPSLADPFSGEIISSTANIYVGLMRDSVASSIRSYLLWKTGKIDLAAYENTGLADTTVPGQPGGPDIVSKQSLAQTIGLLRPVFAAKMTPIYSGTGAKRKLVNTSSDLSIPEVEVNGKKVALWNADDFKGLGLTQEDMANPKGLLSELMSSNTARSARLSKSMANSCNLQTSFMRTSRGLVKAVESQCPEVVAFAKSKIGKDISTDEDLTLVKVCAEKVMYVQYMQTLVHELGHNFGLRHNFRGSAETNPNKYWNPETAKAVFGATLQTDKILKNETAVSNSVMDYYSEDSGGGILQAIPGPYDIAALKFGYTNKVKLANGVVADVYNKSVRDVIGDDINKIDRYSQCSDEVASYNLDPLCNLHDLGRTPVEIVRNAKNRMYDFLVLGLNRYDRRYLNSGPNLAIYRSYVYFEQIQKIYNYWRIQLHKRLFERDPYLASFGTNSRDAAAYKQVIEKEAARNPAFKNFYDLYYPARTEAFDFFMELSLLPNRYCIVKDTKKPAPTAAELKTDNPGLRSNETLIELDFVRGKIRQAEDSEQFKSIISCNDEDVKVYLAKTYNFEVVKEVGFTTKDVKYDISDRAKLRPLDQAGSQFYRVFAMANLSGRSGFLGTGTLEDNYIYNLFPNYFDEPDFRLKAQLLIEDRLLNGVRVDSKYISTNLNKYASQKPVRRYLAEEDLIQGLFVNYISGLAGAPGDIRAIYRGTRYDSLIYDASQKSIYGENVDGIEIGNIIIRPRSPSSTFVSELINEFRQNSTLQSSNGLSILKQDLNESLYKVISQGLPANAEGDFSGRDLLDLSDRIHTAKVLVGAIAGNAGNQAFSDVIDSYLDGIFSIEKQALSLFFGDRIDQKFSIEDQLKNVKEQYALYKKEMGMASTPVPQTPSLVGSDELVTVATQFAKDFKDAKAAVVRKVDVSVKPEYYEKMIKDLEEELGRLNVILRASVKADVKKVYSDNGFDIPTKENLKGRFIETYQSWKVKSDWLNAPENLQEVDAFERVLYSLLIKMGN